MGERDVTEMVERVARVIDPDAWRTGAGDDAEPRRLAAIKKARRAIAVMAVPTAEQRQSTFLKYVYGESERIRYWRWMLRLALNPSATFSETR